MTDMLQLIRKSGGKAMNAHEVVERETLKFLLTGEIPEEGDYCIGVETLSNGLKERTQTDVIQEVKEIATKKYIARTLMGTYLVDVI